MRTSADEAQAARNVADVLAAIRRARPPPFRRTWLSSGSDASDYARLTRIALEAHGNPVREAQVLAWARSWNQDCQRMVLGSIQSEGWFLFQPEALWRRPATDHFFVARGTPEWHERVRGLTAVVAVLSGLQYFSDGLRETQRQLAKPHRHGS